MFKYFNNKRIKGQSTLEYAILIIIIIGALLSIQVYIKRGVQGRLKDATDDIGGQFSPGNTNATTIERTVAQNRNTFFGGKDRDEITTTEGSFEKTNVEIQNVVQEFWGK